MHATPSSGESGAHVLSASKVEVKLALHGGDLTLRPLAPNAIRVRFAPRGTPETPSLFLLPSAPPPHFEASGTHTAVTVSTPRLRVVLDRATDALSFYELPSGRLLLAEKPGTRSLTPSMVQGEPTHAVAQAFESPADERLFGSGQFQDGYLNIRDLPRRLTQVNTQIAIPFLVSSRGYGLLWHNNSLTDLNPADTRVELTKGGRAGVAVSVEVTTAEGTQVEVRTDQEFTGKFSVATAGRYALLLDVGQKMARRHSVTIDGAMVVDQRNYWLPPTTSWLMDLDAGEHTVTVTGEASDQPTLFLRPSADETVLRSPVAEALDYVVFAGPSVDDIITTYRDLTGPTPLPPKWMFGYVHCRERFKSQQELLENAAEFQRRGLPLDLIVQDWQYWGRYGWNSMRFDEADYPDPAAMVAELHAANIRLMVSVWSKIDPQSDLGRAFAERGYYIPGTDWVDFFNPQAASFYWENLRDRLLSLGIDAWWLDATEPENDDLEGRTTAAGIGERMRNAYPYFVNRTVYENQRRDAPDRRVCILTRSAFVGQQRFGTTTWSGDVGNDWETLRRQIAAGLNFMVTGQPWWTTDCGGFFRPGPGQYQDAAYRERFLRWLQFATFCPLQRVHGYQTDTEFWRYGDEMVTEARRWLDLRQRLLPYLYACVDRVGQHGYTLMRPLVMDFADDAQALDCAHQFMFGPALLASPVLAADVDAWETYLPTFSGEGAWFDFWSGDQFAGGRSVRADAPISKMPLHVRAGSIVPLRREASSDAALQIRVHPGADARFDLYFDDGVSYDYERGASVRVPLVWHDATNTLEIGPAAGAGFEGAPAKLQLHVVRVSAGHGCGLDFEAADATVAVDMREGSATKVTLPPL